MRKPRPQPIGWGRGSFVDNILQICYYLSCKGSPNIAGRFGTIPPPKGGEKMPITITFHLFGLVFSIRIKRENRHSAK